MPFAIIGFMLGLKDNHFQFDLSILIYVLLCMIFARNAAMAFNRYIDRTFDEKNPRTKNREIPAGKIKSNHAFLFTIINVILFILVTYFINTLCFYLSPVAIFVILFYSYTKRITPLCHLVLGVGLGLAPVGAYLSVTESFSIVPILLGFAVMFWTGGFDIIYALQDDDFDKEMKLYSIPGVLGRKNALFLSRIFHIITLTLLVFVGIYSQIHWIYWLGYLVFLSMIIYQHSIVKVDDLSRVGIAFGQTNGIASLVFGIISVIATLI